ncbi:phage major tail protein, TP901-1 family [Methyloraptor flagellatus]|jgi:TP901-1 family phage major tail protein|uniref:Phage major tail protein, TP901-1 family n=1 Tax=Methyloraptor flagellatus TaxID=3162530 RepID=A0AAU7X8B4_9HYPH
MATQRGTDLLLKLDEQANGTFVTVAGLRSRKLKLSTDTVDVTDADSPGRWRELLAGAGVRRASISGAGVFRDSASDAAVNRVFFAGAIRPWRIVIPDFANLDGLFQVAALEFSGDHDGEVTFDIALESAGAVSFTAL